MNQNDKLALSFLNPDDIRLYKNENGFLMLVLSGEEKGRVNLKRSYPFSLPDEYICILTLSDDEIGIVRDINALDEASREAAGAELSSRYYCPEINAITSLKEKMGHFYLETLVEGKKKTITVRDISKSVRMIRGDTLLVIDMDGNRYTAEHFSALDKKSQRLLESYLY